MAVGLELRDHGKLPWGHKLLSNGQRVQNGLVKPNFLESYQFYNTYLREFGADQRRVTSRLASVMAF
jgi:hypothetical protein